MNKFFKLFDIYGSEFSLRINGQTKFRSVTGGFFSFVTMAIFIWTVISFGRDFYQRKNPKITMQDGFFDENDKTTFKGGDYNEKFVILQTEKIYEKVMVPYIITNEADLHSATLCNVDFLIEKLIVTEKNDPTLDYFSFYCLRLNDYLIGGITSSNYNPLIISFDSCRQTDLSNKCNKFDFSTYGNFILNIWYERTGFSPNLSNPFEKKWSVKRFILDNSKNNFLSFPLMVYKLKDDIGWLYENEEDRIDFNFDVNSSYLQANTLNENSSPYFNLNFYFSDEYKMYSRNYSKIQDLLAQIGGFMKLVFTIMNLIIGLIRQYQIDNYIINRIFDDNNNIKINLGELNFDVSESLDKSDLSKTPSNNNVNI